MIGAIRPLVTVTGRAVPSDEPGVVSRGAWTVVCRECGDVTREESNFTVEQANTQQANLYRQRHLARHLTALANEVAEAAR